MSKTNKVLKNGIRALAHMTAQSSVNSACVAFIYQPKIPKELKSFAKRAAKKSDLRNDE